tara:strand:- start:252 stop:872 length:621 start_codon:yes stop_codon:yes gene_type:complete
MSQTEVQLIKSSSVVDGDIVGMSSSKLSGALPAISGASLTNLDAGKILQVKQTVKTSFFSTSTTGSGVDVTGVTVTITPASSSNKILVRCFGEYGNDNNDSFASLALVRVLDGATDTGIAVGDTRGSTTRATMNATLRSGGGLSHNVSRHFGCEFLDSPNTTNAIIYKLRIFVVQGTPACVGGSDSDNFNNFVSTPTFITAMEVAA